MLTDSIASENSHKITMRTASRSRRIFASIIAVALATLGCNQTLLVRPRYESSGVGVHLNLGRGVPVRLVVLDNREEKLLLGTTDAYGDRIVLASPLDEVVEESLTVLLGQAGFHVSDSADVTYRVEITRSVCDSQWGGGEQATATILLKAEIVSSGEVLFGKLFSGTAKGGGSFGTSPGDRCDAPVSEAIGKVVDSVGSDNDLLNALLSAADRNGGEAP